MADQGLKIRHSEVKNLDRRSLRGSRLRVEVIDTNGDIHKEVFVYRRKPANQTTGEVIDEFIAVASPEDLTTYPVDAPDHATPFPYFRLSYVELDFQAEAHHETVLQLLLQQLTVLTEAYKRYQLYQSEQDASCGTLTDTS